MRRLIAARFPDHGIIGEEFGREREDAEFVWVLDPIDGTKSFISGVPLFGTLIALAQRGRPILGIIDQPISRERWVGAAGRPTTLQRRAGPLPALSRARRARRCSRPAPTCSRAPMPPRFARVAGAAKLVRFGADCYAYGLLAARLYRSGH